MITDCNDTSGFEELIRRITVKDAAGNKYLRIGTETVVPPFSNAQYLSYDQNNLNQSVDFTDWNIFGTDDFTVSFWINFTTIDRTIYIMHQQPMNPQWFIWFDAADALLKFNASLGLEFPYCTTNPFLAGGWYHCVLWHDRNGICKWYVDTVLQNLTTGIGSANTMSDVNNPMQWGGFPGGDYNTHSIDEICFFVGKLLSDAEITTLFGGGTPQTAGDPTTVTGLTHYWKIDNNTAPAITDQISSVDGVMQNMLQANIVNY